MFSSFEVNCSLVYIIFFYFSDLNECVRILRNTSPDHHREMPTDIESTPQAHVGIGLRGDQIEGNDRVESCDGDGSVDFQSPDDTSLSDLEIDLEVGELPKGKTMPVGGETTEQPDQKNCVDGIDPEVKLLGESSVGPVSVHPADGLESEAKNLGIPEPARSVVVLPFGWRPLGMPIRGWFIGERAPGAIEFLQSRVYGREFLFISI